MTTPKSDNSLERRCTCPSKVEGPNVNIEVNRVATIILSALTPLIGTWPNSCSSDWSLRYLLDLEPTTSHSRNLSFESLKHALSSRGGRESLHALPIEQAIGVIDVLEQVSAKRPGCIATN